MDGLNSLTINKAQQIIGTNILLKDLTGSEPRMWGPSINGFGSYHYKSERNRQEGDWPLMVFSPGEGSNFTLRLHGCKEHEHLLKGLGKLK